MAIKESSPNGKPHVLMMQVDMPYLRDSLESKFNLLVLSEHTNRDEYLAMAGGSVRAVVTSTNSVVGAKLLEKLPNVEIVASFSVGLDKVDLDYCKQKGIVVTNTPEVLTEDCADLAIALLLATMRQICSADRYVRKGCWPKQGTYPLSYKMSGKDLGIVGLGRIGKAVAKRAEAFGCKIKYYARSDKKDVPYEYFSSVLELAKNSTMLVVCCAFTKETAKIIDRRVLDALGPEGFLVNISRGGVVDEPELVKALLECRLGGAGLDVYENEPIVPQELWNMDNVVLLPHVASGTWETRRAMADLISGNLEAHFSGKPVLTPVT
ncbi:glyoxylate/hydroxypyruvate reductase A HPR2 [Physcomitrium patens]|uniref:Uncharacterized protein n=1 Tax=Physcomitrium patens TaxID=3218 RepID=A9RBI7_PHYPA|nr:glyoxylate/hydroxypyruvate reductase A HPR2-like [Physcomitrium patens]PNR56945.1 hypothetical protein PHYPA_003938 [Physcomitrium patens]|eukprot:XP_024371939.1 glyoxylate/hydroxypyruvate reductase A HPR2-like [Physcomitrella patens]